MNIHVDRTIPVPIAAQIRGQIEYGISYGLIGPGNKLPNVRELASTLKVSPATVSRVYGELQQQGIIVSAPGRGTYVSDHLPAPADAGDRLATLDPTIRLLLAQAREAGLSKADLLQRISHQWSGDDDVRGLSIAFVGEFPATSGRYVRAIQACIAPHDRIVPFTFGDLGRRPAARRELADFDLLLTIAHRVNELKALAPPAADIQGVSFIPSEETRTALARIDPLTRVGLISTFAEFLVVLKHGVATFAPHIHIADTAIYGTERAEALLRSCSVVIYASGSEEMVAALGASVTTIEYLHTPDPVYLVKTLAPILADLRAQRDSPPGG